MYIECGEFIVDFTLIITVCGDVNLLEALDEGPQKMSSPLVSTVTSKKELIPGGKVIISVDGHWLSPISRQ